MAQTPLLLRSPTAWPQLQGVYEPLPELVRGQPAWERRGGGGFLSIGAGNGFWFFAAEQAHLEQGTGCIASADTPTGQLPHECQKWEAGDTVSGTWGACPDVVLQQLSGSLQSSAPSGGGESRGSDSPRGTLGFGHAREMQWTQWPSADRDRTADKEVQPLDWEAVRAAQPTLRFVSAAHGLHFELRHTTASHCIWDLSPPHRFAAVAEAHAMRAPSEGGSSGGSGMGRVSGSTPEAVQTESSTVAPVGETVCVRGLGASSPFEGMQGTCLGVHEGDDGTRGLVIDFGPPVGTHVVWDPEVTHEHAVRTRNGWV